MAQTVPYTISFGPSKAGLPVGYQVLNLDRTEYSAFTVTGMVETVTPGKFSVTGGIVAPDAGAYVKWGTVALGYFGESNIDPIPAGIATLTTNVAAILDDTGTSGVVVATASKTGYALSSAGIQAIWDALTSALTTVGSIGKYIIDHFTSLGVSSSINVLSVIDGDDITVYQSDTWIFDGTLGAGVVLTDYEAIAFCVKRDVGIADASGTLYLRSDTGLVAIGGGAPVSAASGVLTIDSATAFSAIVHMTETNVASGSFTWWLKGLDLSATPDRGRTIATGKFMVRSHGVRAIV